MPSTRPDSIHSSSTWMARSSTVPTQSSSTGIKSARKSAWILKSSLPLLTEDAQSTCWRSWSLSSPTGNVRKTFFLLSLHLVITSGDTDLQTWPSLSTLGPLSRGKRARDDQSNAHSQIDQHEAAIYASWYRHAVTG